MAYGTGPRLRNDVDVGYSDVAANRERKWRPIPVHKLVCDVYWTHRLARSTTNEDVQTSPPVCDDEVIRVRRVSIRPAPIREVGVRIGPTVPLGSGPKIERIILRFGEDHLPV